MDLSPQTPSSSVPRLPVGQGFSAPRQISSSGGFRSSSNRSRSTLDVLATILFIIALLGWLGFYGYSFLLKREIQNIAGEIDAIARNFNPATIDSLELLGNRLAHAKQIINEHTALAPLFCFIESNTLTKNIQFSSLNYSRSGELSNPGNQPTKFSNLVRLVGRAGSFESLAYQAKVLENTNKLRALSFNNLSVSSFDGQIEFESAFSLNRDVLVYQPNASANCTLTGTTSSTTTNL